MTTSIKRNAVAEPFIPSNGNPELQTDELVQMPRRVGQSFMSTDSSVPGFVWASQNTARPGWLPGIMAQSNGGDINCFIARDSMLADDSRIGFLCEIVFGAQTLWLALRTASLSPWQNRNGIANSSALRPKGAIQAHISAKTLIRLMFPDVSNATFSPPAAKTSLAVVGSRVTAKLLVTKEHIIIQAT